ncbi:MAG TPA: MoaD/ThiS family protein [Gemmataceae bacterium]|nr:MoaD/ThiS family protein [Gemmataceae bacterium]
MARVWIPSLLRDVTGGTETVTVLGASVGQVIDSLDRLHPGARARLCQGDALRSGLAVVVDNEVARLGLLQPVGQDSEVHFVPAIGGGGPDDEPPAPAEDRRSPTWVLVLLGLLHSELWVAAGLVTFLLIPRLHRVVGAFGIRLPYVADVLAQVVLGFVDFPLLFAVLPVIDATALAVMHRFYPAPRVVRVAWSAVVAGVILFLLLWSCAAHGMTLEKVREGFFRPAPPVAPAPAAPVQ